MKTLKSKIVGLSKFTCKNRLNLDNIMIDEKGTAVATDSYRLVEIANTGYNEEQQPDIIGTKHYKENKKIFIKADKLKTLKPIKKTNLPVLKDIMVRENGDNILLNCTDLSSTQSITCEQEEIKYPKYENIIPSKDEYKENPSLYIDAEQLEEILKIMKDKENRNNIVKLTMCKDMLLITGEDKKNKDTRAILMKIKNQEDKNLLYK